MQMNDKIVQIATTEMNYEKKSPKIYCGKFSQTSDSSLVAMLHSEFNYRNITFYSAPIQH